MVEVLAARDPSGDLPPKPRRKGPPAGAPAPAPRDLDTLRRELEAAQDRIRYLSRLVCTDHFSHLTPRARELYLDLVEAELDGTLAMGLLEDLPKRPAGESAPSEALRRRLRPLVKVGATLSVGEPTRQSIAFVGAPGVGKTTTCAKLAAQLRDAGASVGLLSLDTNRMAGALHLQAYAEVLGLPVAVAYTPEEVASAVNGLLAPVSFVVVDTPGLSWSAPQGLRRLRELLDPLPGLRIHLLLAAPTRTRDQLRHLERFRALGLSGLSFTRIDETESYGAILTLSLKSGLPVGYLGDGQRVPEDLHTARVEELLDLLMEGLDDLAGGEDVEAARPAAQGALGS
jgi:flagellar biosynthesis protein FlhF